jgi:mono/diheme cytochrome c family protein
MVVTAAAVYRPRRGSQPDAELKRAIREGKGPMPPFAPLFDDSQLTLLVAYIRGFDPKR